MKKLMALLLALLICFAAALADTGSRPEIPQGTLNAEVMPFTPGQTYAVYSAPDSRSIRGAKGRARVSTNGWIQVFGAEGDWLLVQNETNGLEDLLRGAAERGVRIALNPSPITPDAWAKKLFPNLSKAQAVEKLWEAILAASRVDDDPVAAWKAHNEDLARRCAYLNDLGITELEYHSSNGTNFKVGMIEDAEFKGGGENSLLGHFFNPNIPTEEVFISPKRGVAEGIVYSTKPLSYQGQLIENFSIRFEGGKAVEVHAEKNEALLQKLISMDEGASYLGECALVPYNSPIQNSGLLFYNTLFDENAACHLALGMGFADTIKNFENYTLDECRAKGINDSMVHEDFMIGSADLSIDAHTRDGRTVPIFRDGNWAF